MVSYSQWVLAANKELLPDLANKDLTRKELVRKIPDEWDCLVPTDLARELPLAGSFCYDYGAPQINRMIAEILTGDQALVQQMYEIIKEVYDLEFYTDMDEFEEDIQIDECLDYIESEEEENFDPVIESALLQFEEDFDYEKSLYEENKASEKQQINLHRLLSCDPNTRPHWAGHAPCEFFDDVRLEAGSQNGPLQTDRFTLDVLMITDFPEGKSGGYALGKTPYGLVYFPSKFRGFVETFRDNHLGQRVHTGWYSVTVALRDAASRENDRVKSVFTAVYNHGELE